MFTPQQIANFKAFKKVQESGDYNMFDPRARQATGLNRYDYMFVMKNYDALAKQAEEEKQ